MHQGIAAAALAALLAARAGAGVYIETAEKEPGAKQATTDQRMWVQGGAGRFESDGQISILKGEALTILDPAERTYTVMDKASFAKFGQRMSSAMAQIQKQMADLPPEQRAAMERMMGGGGMPGQAPAPVRVEAVDTGRSETIDGRTCRTWTLKRNGVAEEQHCVVPFGSLPGNEDLRAVFARMAKLVEGMKDALPEMSGAAFEEEFSAYEKMNGFPVLTRELDAKGRPTGAETRVVTWRAESVPAAQFEVPKGYTRREMFDESED